MFVLLHNYTGKFLWLYVIAGIFWKSEKLQKYLFLRLLSEMD